MVKSQLTATSTSQVPAILPASAFQVAGITATRPHAKLIFFEAESGSIPQAGVQGHDLG